MLTRLTSRRLVWARGLWSELHEHDILEPAWLVTPSDEDYVAAKDESPSKAPDFGQEQRAFERSETKH